MKKDFISIKDYRKEEIEKIFELADKLKTDKSCPLIGKSICLIFQKPSNRTRVSFEVGIYQLGANAIYLSPEDLQLGKRESTKDVAMVLSRYVDAAILRTFYHNDIVEFARYSTIPVINGLSDLLHPCQGLSDLYTIRQKKGKLEGINIAFIGDGNNVLHSLLHGCSKMGVNINIATPKGYEPNKKILEESVGKGCKIALANNPEEAVKGADIIYTDVWTSMGKEGEYRKRLRHFKGFQINKELVKKAKNDCLIMHCLPAHRKEEITDEVIDGPQSIVFDQAENRLHVQKAILVYLLGK